MKNIQNSPHHEGYDEARNELMEVVKEIDVGTLPQRDRHV